AGDLKAGAFGQIFHRLDEAEVVVVHQEAQRRAMRAAAKAVIELFVRDHGEGGRLLAVEGAAGLVFLTLALQRHTRGDQLGQIGTSNQFIDEMLGDASGHEAMRARSGEYPSQWAGATS